MRMMALDGYHVRRPAVTDVAAVTALIRACEVVDFGVAERTEEDTTVALRTIDPQRDAWLVEDERGRLAAAAAVRAPHPTNLRAFVVVHPDYRGRGVGTHLLALSEGRAGELAAAAPPGEDVKLTQGVGPHNDAARTLLEKHGYAFVRRFWRMGIDLRQELPEAEWPEGIRAEPLGGNEREVFDAMEEAFADHWGFTPHDYEEWRAWMVDRDDFDPSLWIVVRDGDELAAASLNYVSEGVGWVGVLGVRKPWRKRGLGLALLRAGFREFRARGLETAVLEVDSENATGATRLYERAGMHVVHHSDAFQKLLVAGA
jgi:mycothiol synthase